VQKTNRNKFKFKPWEFPAVFFHRGDILDYNRIQEIENAIYNNQNQNQNQQNNNTNNHKEVENMKIRVCSMLQDLYSEDYKKIAYNCIIDELSNVLKLSLVAQDRIFFEAEFRKMTGKNVSDKSEKQVNEFKSAESLVNKSKDKNKEK